MFTYICIYKNKLVESTSSTKHEQAPANSSKLHGSKDTKIYTVQYSTVVCCTSSRYGQEF